jgi:predicted RNA-binding protein with PIN domain
MTRRLVVDGANVVGSRPDGWWRDRPGAARRLYEALLTIAAAGDDVVLVLEGAARAGVPEQQDGAVTVVHATRDGDSAIVEFVAAQPAPAEWTVVTADRELRERVRSLGAEVAGPSAVR